MNKLEEIHAKLIHSKYDDEIIKDIGFIQESIKKEAKESAEITTDVAIKFAEWIDSQKNSYSKLGTDYWYEIIGEELQPLLIAKNSKELFQIFINNHYGS